MDKTATETLEKAAKALGLSGTETEAQFLPTLEKVLLEKQTLAEQVNKSGEDAGLASQVQVAELTQKLETSEAEKQRLDGQLTQKTEAIGNLEAQIQALTQQGQSTHPQNVELVALQGEKTGLEVEVQELENKNAELQQIVERLKASGSSSVTKMLSTEEAEKMADDLITKAKGSVQEAFATFFAKPDMEYHEIPVATALYNKLLQDPAIKTPEMLHSLCEQKNLVRFGSVESGFQHGVGFSIINPLTGNEESYIYPSVLHFKGLETKGMETEVYSLADKARFGKNFFNLFVDLIEKDIKFYLDIPLCDFSVIKPKKVVRNQLLHDGRTFQHTEDAWLAVKGSFDSYKRPK